MNHAAMMAVAGLCLALGLPAQATPRVHQAAKVVAAPLAGEPVAQHAVAKVIVLYANNSGKGIDPRIGDMPQLEQPPFSAYDSYQLLDRAKLALDKGAWAELALPNQGKLTIRLNEIGKKFDLSVRIQKPGGKRLVNATMKARADELFFMAGPKHKKGILVLGIRVAAK